MGLTIFPVDRLLQWRPLLTDSSPLYLVLYLAYRVLGLLGRTPRRFRCPREGGRSREAGTPRPQMVPHDPAPAILQPQREAR